VFAAMDNVAGEVAEAEGQLTTEIEKCANENDKASEEEERATEFAEGVHKIEFRRKREVRK
jgi:hypothetical protein